jgi:Adenylate and Guanylate cyclase catalytic domain
MFSILFCWRLLLVEASNNSDEMNGTDETEAVIFSDENEQPHQDSPSAMGQVAEQDDSPEAIVRRENQVIKLLRGLTVTFLLLAAGATVTFIYFYMSRTQKDRFESEYNALASTLISSLHLDMRLHFWMAHTISKATTLAMVMGDKSATNFTIPTSLWDGVTQEARWTGDHLLVSWIPFLYTDEERMDFEAHVRDTWKDDHGQAEERMPCYICGGPGLVVQDESATAELAGLTFSCGDAYTSGLNGAIPDDLCISAQTTLASVCPCVRPPENTIQTTESESQQRAEWDIRDGLYTYRNDDDDGEASPIPQDFERAPYAPMYAISYRGDEYVPPLYDLLSDPVRGRALTAVMFNGKAAISEMRSREGPYYQYHTPSVNGLSSDLYYPVFSDESESRLVVGAIGFEFTWNSFLTGAVPVISDRVSLVAENTCGQVQTYVIDPVSNILVTQGSTDLHDRKYDTMVHSTTYEEYDTILKVSGPRLAQAQYCSYRFKVFPTQQFEAKYVTSDPIVYAAAAGLIIVVTSLVFLFYDVTVRRRQAKIMASAKRTNDIVTSLFPESVRGRLYERAAGAAMTSNFSIGEQDSRYFSSARSVSAAPSDSIFGSDPIADLFPHTTVMFLDIEGFTAWSSERDPSQVFKLLESLYHGFDAVARQLGVFKVETIGDCYVAVAGLPRPRKDHAVGTSFFCMQTIAIYLTMI